MARRNYPIFVNFHGRGAGAGRGGFTLLEVLISAIVIMVGLVGIASLIPAGKFQISQALQKDMATNYGRAGLRLIMTSGFLKNNPPQYVNWGENDVLLRNNRLNDQLDEGVQGSDFDCSDDLVIKEVAGAKFPTYDTHLKPNYEWVATIFDLQNGYYEVSVAVCHKRPIKINEPGVKEFGGSTTGTLLGRGYGGGDISLADGTLDVQAGEWVFVSDNKQGHWYKVITVAMDQGVNAISISGPDWVGGGTSVKVSTPGKVVGVFTEIMSANTW